MNNIMQNISLLLVPLIIVTIMFFMLLKSNKKNQTKSVFITILFFMILWFIELILQLICSNKFNIDPLFFENFVYISACIVPILILFLAITFVKTKINFTLKHLLLFIVPIISLLVLWTNNYHHLFYIKYSTNFRETVFGPYFTIHSLYSYLCVGIGMIILLVYSIKNSGIFSKQSLLFVIGTSICLIINILSTFGILDLSIYATPISFTIGILFYAIAIFKFNFLSVAPIALQKVVDRISDSYVVLDDTYNITDFNHTLTTTFNISEKKLRKSSLFSLVKKLKLNIDTQKLLELIQKAKKTKHTVRIEKELKTINKYFNIEICSIYSEDMYLGTLILLKDITQHIEDMHTIEDNQDRLIEKERLASLGQLIGGISHNLKTPIMSISGAAEGISDLIKEYDASIGDPEVTNEDHHEIANDMRKWVEKIREYTAYMSDIITAVKGQAVTLSSDNDVDFTIDELIKRVDILMKHELKNALITLNTQINVDKNTTLDGDVNSLVQVVNNLISNAIQAYEGKTEQQINFIIDKIDSNLVIKVQDFGSGMSKEVQQKLFKEMITTKGKNGSGLGLFMSYSTIKSNFKGDLSFETEEGKGTTFTIKIPM
mgnify:FL=1|jgi:two-component system sensor histidine kinase HupT/HoxJ